MKTQFQGKCKQNSSFESRLTSDACRTDELTQVFLHLYQECDIPDFQFQDRCESLTELNRT